MASAAQQAASADPHAGAGTLTLQVKYEKTTHEVAMHAGESAALLQTRLFLLTNVLPTRQKLMGFKGAANSVKPVCFCGVGVYTTVHFQNKCK